MNKQNAKELLPTIVAFSEGKTIQVHCGQIWRDNHDPDFDLPPSLYRIKPEFLTREELLKLCGGKEPHRWDNWREEWLQDGWRPLLAQECRKDQDEFWSSGSWHRGAGCEPMRAVHSHSRTRRPLPVEPKLVPLSQDDVPCGSYFAEVERDGDAEPSRVRYSPTCILPHEVQFFNQYGQKFAIEFQYMADSKRWFIKRPNHSDWQPASKPA